MRRLFKVEILGPAAIVLLGIITAYFLFTLMHSETLCWREGKRLGTYTTLDSGVCMAAIDKHWEILWFWSPIHGITYP